MRLSYRRFRNARRDIECLLLKRKKRRKEFAKDARSLQPQKCSLKKKKKKTARLLQFRNFDPDAVFAVTEVPAPRQWTSLSAHAPSVPHNMQATGCRELRFNSAEVLISLRKSVVRPHLVSAFKWVLMLRRSGPHSFEQILARPLPSHDNAYP